MPNICPFCQAVVSNISFGNDSSYRFNLTGRVYHTDCFERFLIQEKERLVIFKEQKQIENNRTKITTEG